MTGKKNKLKRILQPIQNIFSIILYLFNLMWKRIDENIVSIINILIIVLPTIIVYCFSYLKVMDLCVIILVLQIILMMCKKIIEISKSKKNGFPILRKRYTEKIGETVMLKKGSLQEAIIYLNEVEEYAESNDLIKH